MDNATIHKHPGVVHAIKAVGAQVIWTAAYSPDLNPIERCFSYYKNFIRGEMWGEMWAFRMNPAFISDAALAHSVTRKNMCNLYNGKALQGCIRNIPQEDEGEELAMTILVLFAVNALVK